MIGWLLDTNVIAEIIRPHGSAPVEAWAASHDEATFCLSILTIAEYDKGIANLPDSDPSRIAFMTTRDSTTRNSLAARFAERQLCASDAIIRRWGVVSGTVLCDTGHPPPVISGAAVFNPWDDDPAGFPVLSGRRPRSASRRPNKSQSRICAKTASAIDGTSACRRRPAA